MRVNYDVLSKTEQLSVYNRHALHLTGDAYFIGEEFKFSPYLHQPHWYPGTLPCLSVFRGLCSARKCHFSLSADCYVVYDPTQAAVENAFFPFPVGEYNMLLLFTANRLAWLCKLRRSNRCAALSAVIFPQQLKYVHFLNSCGIKMHHFVKENKIIKESSKGICGKYH